MAELAPLLLGSLRFDLPVKLRVLFLWGVRGTLGLLRSKCVPAALHGAESSHVSDTNLNSLRTAFVAAAWSSRMPLAHPGAVLSLLDGPGWL